MWQRNGMKGGRGKSPHWKGKGRGKAFGPLKGKGKGKGKRWFPLGKGKGKGKSKGGKSAHTGKGKASRPRCWNCGQHGHVEKDCRNVAAVTEENEELYDDWTKDVTEYYDEDWMDWTGALTDDWSYGFDYDWTQLDWYDDSDWYDYGWTDTWTWSTGSDSTGTSALSQPQQPAASSSTAASSTSFTGVQSGQTAATPNMSALHSAVNVTDLETGETITHTPSRRTGSLTRPLRTGAGLLSAIVSVIAVMNSFGRPQGLPLIPETVSSPEVNISDEYDDVLGRHHEDCISSLPPKEHWILFDSGAAAHCCPLDYAPDYPLLPVGRNPPKLRSVTGKPLIIIGRKLVRYDASGVTFFVNYYVCDVPFCIVSVARMLLQGFCTVLSKDSMKLLTPKRESIDITRHGTLLYLTPDFVPYHPDMKIIEEDLDQYHERTGHRHV